MKDRELVRRARRGDKEALGEIAGRYYDDIYRFCYYMTGEQEDSYDLSQEVFLRFFSYIDSYRHKNLKGYLLIIARNLCRDYFRREKKAECMEVPDREKKDDPMESVELELLLNELLGQLEMEQREVIILRIREELKFREIAEILRCPLSTVKSRYRLGIEKMRTALEAQERKFEHVDHRVQRSGRGEDRR